MIVVVARLKVQAGKEATFETEAGKLIAHVKANEPGTVTYKLCRSQADATDYVFYEEYADPAAFATHGGSEPMAAFFGAAGGLLAGRPEITMFEMVAGKP